MKTIQIENTRGLATAIDKAGPGSEIRLTRRGRTVAVVKVRRPQPTRAELARQCRLANEADQRGTSWQDFISFDW